MSTAQEILEDAYARIGRGSEILAVDSTLLSDGLNVLISRMEFLRKNEIILEETVSGTTTTIALPTLLSDELDEPAAAREDLVNYLAVYLAPLSRTPIADMKAPPAAFSLGNLRGLYYQPAAPNKVPSKLLPRGQGARNGRGSATFFGGESIADDVTES